MKLSTHMLKALKRLPTSPEEWNSHKAVPHATGKAIRKRGLATFNRGTGDVVLTEAGEKAMATGTVPSYHLKATRAEIGGWKAAGLHFAVVHDGRAYKAGGPAWHLAVFLRPVKTRPGHFHSRVIFAHPSRDEVVWKARVLLGDYPRLRTDAEPGGPTDAV